MTGYDLSRAWFNFSFDNPEKVKTIHTAIYFFAIEHCNRLGGKEKFGFPSQMTMDAIGIKRHQTYSKAFKEIISWGFFTLIEESKNQYSANIISISAPTKNAKARGKALDKAMIKHKSKHRQGNSQSTDYITKPINQLTNKPIKEGIPPFDEFLNFSLEKSSQLNIEIDEVKLKSKYLAWKENGWKTGKGNKIKNWKSTLLQTLTYIQKEKPKKGKLTGGQEWRELTGIRK